MANRQKYMQIHNKSSKKMICSRLELYKFMFIYSKAVSLQK